MNIFSRYRDNFKANLLLAWPIILGQMGQVSVNFADNVMVGHLGALPLAGVSLANAIFAVFMVMGMGLSMALAPLVSYAAANEDDQSVSMDTKHSFVINVTFGILAALIIELSLPYTYLLRQDPQVLEYAIPYLRISMWTLIPMMIFLTMRGYSEGLHLSKPPMISIIIGNILNIGLNYILIYGSFGIEALGAKGAALASLIARIVMIFILFGLFLKHEALMQPIRQIRWTVYKIFNFRKVLEIGVPSSLQFFFEVSAFSMAAIIMGMVSSHAQAAHQVAISLASMTFMFCTGVSMAASVRVGHHYGKNDMEQVRNAGISSMIMVSVFMALTGVLFVLLKDLLPLIYIRDPHVVEICSLLLLYAAIFQIPDGLQVTALGSLRGLQDVRIPTFITLLAYWLFGIPVSYITAISWGWGVNGVWLGLILSLTCSSILLITRFLKISKVGHTTTRINT